MKSLVPASFEEFEAEVRDASDRANVIPVVRSLAMGNQTPVALFERLAKTARYAFLFESVEGGESVARYTFFGAEPEMIVRGQGNRTIIETSDGVKIVEVPVPEVVRTHFCTRRLAHRDGMAPLAGGAVGYLGFQAANWFEPVLARKSRTEPNRDDAVWMFFRTVVAFDRARQQIEITSIVFAEDAGSDRDRLRELYHHAVERTARLECSLFDETDSELRGTKVTVQSDAGVRSTAGHLESQREPVEPESNWTREGFEEAAAKIKEHIRRGDCYQVVLSQRFSRQVAAQPVSIYRTLRALNPSPYMFFLRLGDETVLGASPEMLVRCRGREIEYRPIAGTRPRGTTGEEDHRLGEAMRVDEKEVAEHVMLVDLGRNDLGRVCEYGSVRVEELMNVERYSHVQHLVSSLRGRLRAGLDRFDALASCFPAGTVSGAPKVRAIEIIRELEPEERGVYAGAILYIDYAGNLDSCIAIRTLVLDQQGTASVQAGAGIVADSVPQLEYEETVAKARALFRAIEIAEELPGSVESGQF